MGEDRFWKIHFRDLSDGVAKMSGSMWQSKDSDWQDEMLLECPEKYVMTGLESHYRPDKSDRNFRIHCKALEVSPSYSRSNPWWTQKYSGDFSFTLDAELFVIGMSSSYDSETSDRKYSLKLIKLE